VIFVDSSFWVALRNADDQHHGEARDLWVAHRAGEVVTTNHVRGETWTFLRQRVGRPSALDFLDSLRKSVLVRVEFVTEVLEAEAWRWLRRHHERDYSFVDATSFAVMRGLRIGEALAFDGDFSAAGFLELRA
jgi:predicted nucleic acid-binding protein